MLETCRGDARRSDLPAITHVDGSARLQTVDERRQPALRRACSKPSSARTGCPLLLNTSFNLRGEPIVCTPADAVLCFVRSDLDCLVLEDLLLDRDGLPPSWRAAFGSTLPYASGVSDSVYALF